MRFILPAGALTSLNFLRDDYQKERSVNLDEAPSMFRIPPMFGGTDVVSRDAQTKFLRKMLVVFAANLIKEEEIKTPEQWEANLTASRVMIAACLYVQSQIPSPQANSALYRLINSSLGINSENYLDDEDKEICYLAADRVIKSSLMALDQANAALRKAEMKPFSELEWRQFSNYLTEVSIKKISENPYTNYPITSITQPMFGAAFSYTGATLGFLGGGMVSESTKAISPKVQLTALIGSTLLMVGPGPMGVALFSQVIACKLITSFCSISLAHILGTAMGILGQGVGMGVGLPLDLAYRLLWKSCALIGGYYGTYPNTSKLTGIRIIDGTTMIGGIPFQLTPLTDSDLAKGYEQKTVEIKEDGTLYIDGELVTIPEGGIQLPPDVLAELKRQLESFKKEPIVEPDEETSALTPAT